MKPSALFIKTMGAGTPEIGNLDGRLTLLAGEMERQFMGRIGVTSESADGTFSFKELLDASYRRDLVEDICKEGLLANLSGEDLELVLCAIRTRAAGLHARELQHSSRHKRMTMAVATGVFGLALYLGILSTQTGVHDAMRMAKATNLRQTTHDAQGAANRSLAVSRSVALDSTQAALPSPAPAVQAPTAPPAGLLLFGDENAPNKLEAWLTMTCGECGTAWDTLRSGMEESLGPGQACLRVNLIPPSDKTFLTLDYYYEALKDQNPEVAKEFLGWVYQNQANLAGGGIKENGLAWLRDKLEFEKFRKVLISDQMRDKLQALADQTKRLNLPGTPALFVNGHLLLGEAITPENIKALFVGARAEGDAHGQG